jgi:hypothetical protein
LDDIFVPELGIMDDVESLDSEWVADGFLRTGQTVDQQWGLAFIPLSDTPTITTTFAEDGDAVAEIEVPVEGMVVIVSPMAPLTAMTTNYTLEFFPQKPPRNN